MAWRTAAVAVVLALSACKPPTHPNTPGPDDPAPEPEPIAAPEGKEMERGERDQAADR